MPTTHCVSTRSRVSRCKRTLHNARRRKKHKDHQGSARMRILSRFSHVNYAKCGVGNKIDIRMNLHVGETKRGTCQRRSSQFQHFTRSFAKRSGKFLRISIPPKGEIRSACLRNTRTPLSICARGARILEFPRSCTSARNSTPRARPTAETTETKRDPRRSAYETATRAK